MSRLIMPPKIYAIKLCKLYIHNITSTTTVCCCFLF